MSLDEIFQKADSWRERDISLTPNRHRIETERLQGALLSILQEDGFKTNTIMLGEGYLKTALDLRDTPLGDLYTGYLGFRLQIEKDGQKQDFRIDPIFHPVNGTFKVNVYPRAPGQMENRDDREIFEGRNADRKTIENNIAKHMASVVTLPVQASNPRKVYSPGYGNPSY